MLLCLAKNTKDLRAALRAGTFHGLHAILHGDFRRVLDLHWTFTLHTTTFNH
jgi:hypothetical protein